MPNLDLSFASGEQSLSVRHFRVEQGMNADFTARIVARSPDEDLDMEAIVGRAALFRVESGVTGALIGTRVFSGICSAMSQVEGEDSDMGLSTYELTIVPKLHLLHRRSGYRLFQHVTVPDILRRLLGEHGIEAVFRVATAAYPKLELRTQYGETDHHFLSRLCEEAGISFFFEDDFDAGSQLVFSDEPGRASPRALPLPWLGNPSANQALEAEYVTDGA